MTKTLGPRQAAIVEHGPSGGFHFPMVAGLDVPDRVVALVPSSSCHTATLVDLVLASVGPVSCSVRSPTVAAGPAGESRSQPALCNDRNVPAYTGDSPDAGCGCGFALRRLTENGYNPAMPTNLSSLVAALSAPDRDTRATAAEHLAQLGTEAQAAAVALVLACGDETEEVQQWAAAALEALGPPSVSDVSRLVTLIQTPPPDVGYWAATLLGRLKAEAAPGVDALAHALGGPQDIIVRQRAAWALGEIGPAASAAIPALQQTAGAPNARLARLAREAIEKIAG